MASGSTCRALPTCPSSSVRVLAASDGAGNPLCTRYDPIDAGGLRIRQTCFARDAKGRERPPGWPCCGDGRPHGSSTPAREVGRHLPRLPSPFEAVGFELFRKVRDAARGRCAVPADRGAKPCPLRARVEGIELRTSPNAQRRRLRPRPRVVARPGLPPRRPGGGGGDDRHPHRRQAGHPFVTQGDRNPLRRVATMTPYRAIDVAGDTPASALPTTAPATCWQCLGRVLERRSATTSGPSPSTQGDYDARHDLGRVLLTSGRPPRGCRPSPPSLRQTPRPSYGLRRSRIWGQPAAPRGISAAIEAWSRSARVRPTRRFVTRAWFGASGTAGRSENPVAPPSPTTPITRRAVPP